MHRGTKKMPGLYVFMNQWDMLCTSAGLSANDTTVVPFYRSTDAQLLFHQRQDVGGRRIGMQVVLFKHERIAIVF